ncbi:MAG TPA: phosphotransferase [Candidatus Baltobacteraceae bacterium]|nr:phosphotransferase [Candidatus Baltobacteraceae bacterium]
MISEVSRLRRDWDTNQTQQYIRELPVWTGQIDLQQKFGGLQNRTYFVTDGDGKRYVVRCGFDQYRTRQTSVVHCTLAAACLGIGPQLRYAEPNVTITDFVTGPPMQVEQLRDREFVAKVVKVIKSMHEGSEAVGESISYWWAFHTVRRYLKTMETGAAPTQWKPSEWVAEVPFFREVSYRLERAIGPFNPCFTHNDLTYVNIMYSTPTEEKIWLIDWDGGAYGHPMWDIAEMSLLTGVDDDFDRYVLECYWGKIDESRMKTLLHEHRAFKMMAGLRLITEVMVTAHDPFFYLTPDEMAKSMAISFPGQQLHLNGLADLLRPGFEQMWATYGANYK